jgi:lactam utilization protein B
MSLSQCSLPADKLKEIRDQGDIQVINDTFLDRQYRRFGLIVKPKVEPRLYRGEGDFKGP